MANHISTMFLRDTRHGGAPTQPHDVAAALIDFVAAAQHTLDLAIYDFRLTDALATDVVAAFVAAAGRGVRVRIGYDAGKPAAADALTFAALQADPAPPGTGDFLQAHFAGTPVQLTAIKAAPQLMHSKYLVRDATGSAACVWTGSTNFTDDAWTLQENNIVQLASPTLAKAYDADFAELWQRAAITGTGRNDSGSATIDAQSVGWAFAPGRGSTIDATLTQRVQTASERIVIAAMVLTSHGLLAALASAIERGVPVSGIYDAGQMDPIVRQWHASAASAGVAADFATVAAHLQAKHSRPYTPTGPHDFMHNKILITDDVVSTGSYNFSANAEKNAENQIHAIGTGVTALADVYADYVATIASAYANTTKN